jgi:KaiC/GvpD/RAD55 family RecA-like ATPase
MAGTLNIPYDWAKSLFPGGIQYPSSTVISGRGGSGKPLVQLAFVAEWIRNGGKALGIPLQYPNASFLKNSIYKLYNLDLNQYRDQNRYIRFDPEMENMEKATQDEYRANLLIPEVWDRVMAAAREELSASREDLLVYGSALNLLLFAPRYQDEVVEKMEKMLEDTQNATYLFTVSNNVLGDKIARWEQASDHLLFTRMNKNRQLFIYATRINGKAMESGEPQIPIQPETLDEIRAIAEKNRKTLIPKLKKLK